MSIPNLKPSWYYSLYKPSFRVRSGEEVALNSETNGVVPKIKVPFWCPLILGAVTYHTNHNFENNPIGISVCC